jgi:hypothetical protein
MNRPICCYRKAAPHLVALGLLTLSGCGARTGDVTGKVTFGDKTVASGSVMIIASDSLAYHGVIDDEGNYTIAKVPVGQGKMAVFSPGPDAFKDLPLPPQFMAKGVIKPVKPPPFRDDEKKWFSIPEKYQKFDESGLKVEVKSGVNKRDIPLE